MPSSTSHFNRRRRRSGFTLLLAVLIASVVLAIGTGIFNIVIRELQLSALARDSDTALYAADAGLECGLFWEYKGLDQDPEVHFDPTNPASQTIECGGYSIVAGFDAPAGSPTTTWTFKLPVGDVTGSRQSCAVVRIEKNEVTLRSSINSSGRNEGGGVTGGGVTACDPGSRTVERTLESNF